MNEVEAAFMWMENNIVRVKSKHPIARYYDGNLIYNGHIVMSEVCQRPSKDLNAKIP